MKLQMVESELLSHGIFFKNRFQLRDTNMNHHGQTKIIFPTLLPVGAFLVPFIIADAINNTFMLTSVTATGFLFMFLICNMSG